MTNDQWVVVCSSSSNARTEVTGPFDTEHGAINYAKALNKIHNKIFSQNLDPYRVTKLQCPEQFLPQFIIDIPDHMYWK